MATSKENVQKILSGELSFNSVKSPEELKLLYNAGLTSKDLRKLVIDGKIDVQSLSAKMLYELVMRDVLRVRNAEYTDNTVPRAVSAEWNNDFEDETNEGSVEVVNGVPVVYLGRIKNYGLTDTQKTKFEKANNRMPKVDPADIETTKPIGEVVEDSERHTGGAVEPQITKLPDPTDDDEPENENEESAKKSAPKKPDPPTPRDIAIPDGDDVDEDEDELNDPSIAGESVEMGETPEEEVEEVQREFYGLPEKIRKHKYAFEREDHVRVPISLAPTHINLKYVQNFDIATLEASYQLFLGDAYGSSQAKKCIDDLKGACKDSKSLKVNKIKDSPAKFKTAMERLSCLFTYDIDLKKINYSVLDKWAQKKYESDPEKYKKFLKTIVLLNDPNNKEITEANRDEIKQAKINLANYIGEYEADLHKNDLAYQKKIKSILDITAVTGASIVGGLAMRYLMAIPNHLGDPWGLLMLCLSVNGVPVVGIMAGLALASGAVLVIAKIIKARIDNVKKYNKQTKALKKTAQDLAGHKQGLSAIRKKYALISPDMSADEVAGIMADSEPKTKEEKAQAKKDKEILDVEDALQLIADGDLSRRLSKKKSLAGKRNLTKKVEQQVKDDIIYALTHETPETKAILDNSGLQGLYVARLAVALEQAKKGQFESLRDKQLAYDLAQLRKANSKKPIVAVEVVSPEGKKIVETTKLGMDRKLTPEEYEAIRQAALEGNISETNLRLVCEAQRKLDEEFVIKALQQSRKEQKKIATADMKAELKALEKKQLTDEDGKVYTKKEIAKSTKETKKALKKAGDKDALDLMEKTAKEKQDQYLAARQAIIDHAQENAEAVGHSTIIKKLLDNGAEKREAEETAKFKAKKKAEQIEINKETWHQMGHEIATGLKKLGKSIGKPFRAMFPPKDAQTGTTLGGSPTSAKNATKTTKTKGGIAR